MQTSRIPRAMTPDAEPNAEAMPLDPAAGVSSDIVSLHCAPLTPETTHLIDQAALARMKRARI